MFFTVTRGIFYHNREIGDLHVADVNQTRRLKSLVDKKQTHFRKSVLSKMEPGQNELFCSICDVLTTSEVRHNKFYPHVNSSSVNPKSYILLTG